MDENSNLGPVSMEDNRVERLKKRDKRRKRFAFIRIIFIIAIIGAAAFFGYKAYSEFLKNKNTSDKNIYYTPAAQTKCIGYKNIFITTTVDGTKMINHNGEDVLEDLNNAVSPYIKGMTEPIFVTNDKTVLAYDVSGKTAVLFSESGIINTYNFPSEIIKAKMSETGKFVVITKEDGSKAAVKVFNNDGSEMMTWYSGSGYVVDAQISDTKSSMAVLTNEITNSQISSKILFFTFDSPEPYMGKVLGNSLASYVSYFDETAYIICNDCMYFVDEKGDMQKVTDFVNKNMKFFKSFKNGNVMICSTASEDEKYDVSVYNIKGKEMSSFQIDSFLSIADVSKDKLLILKRKGIISLNDRGKVVRELSCPYDVKNAAYYKDKIAVLSQDTIFFY